MALRFIAVIVLGMFLGAREEAQTMDEYQVKAAFLYNFAKFVEWPSLASSNPQAPIAVCVLGHNPFGSSLADVIRGKSIEARPVVYRQVDDADAASGCQILFVASVECRRFRSMYGNLKRLGVLTVGETEGFASDGGVINFKLEDGRVRFEVNVDAAERAQLHISSKLLSLAQIVRTEKPR